MANTPDSGIIFKIRRFSLHDGPGIRTCIFMKGCPLKCSWCHSPEGISSDIGIWHHPDACIGCGLCTSVCRQKALMLFKSTENIIKINRDLCNLAGDCVTACPANSIRFTGKMVSISEITEEIEKDLAYYQSSGGGVTLTGGEPLFQPFFSAGILKNCRELGVHTAIETCLLAERKKLDLVAEHVDLFITDLKIDDPETHKNYTGRSNETIKDNFRYLAASGKKIIVRIPIIKEITDTEENISAIIKFVKEINKEIPIEYINYNPLTRNNYDKLGLPFTLR
jgi:pyruvate formate lyase activating enzyme